MTGKYIFFDLNVQALLFIWLPGGHQMNSGKTVFSQLMNFLPWYQFTCAVRRYQGDYRVRTLTCRDQFQCMLFGQLSFRESLRDIVICLRAQASKLYHMGIRGTISRSTLADANEKRDWRIYATCANENIRYYATCFSSISWYSNQC